MIGGSGSNLRKEYERYVNSSGQRAIKEWLRGGWEDRNEGEGRLDVKEWSKTYVLEWSCLKNDLQCVCEWERASEGATLLMDTSVLGWKELDKV